MANEVSISMKISMDVLIEMPIKIWIARANERAIVTKISTTMAKGIVTLTVIANRD